MEDFTPSLLFSRELSWIEFNQRVLDEAFESENPLLERVKFLAISASNLDEYFMVRIGGLNSLLKAGIDSPGIDGMTVREQLAAALQRLQVMVETQYRCLNEILLPALRKEGIACVAGDDLDALDESGTRELRKRFETEIFPVLTPRKIRSMNDFPAFPGTHIHLAVRLAPGNGQSKQRFSLVTIPTNLGRFVKLPKHDRYVFIEDVVIRFLDELFLGQKILEVIPFRITRNADMSVKEDDACDLLQRMREVLEARKQSFCVRLEIRHDASRILLRFLKRCLKIDDTSVFRIPGPLNLKDFFVIAGLRGFQRLKNADWPSYPHPDFRSGETIFDSISRRDILLFHPYDAYDPVVRFVEEAADDPEVIGIKQILYRTSRESPIVSALVRAASNGKSVTAFIELKARFDEDRNIRRAQEMEQAGVQVIYGVQQLKTHAKLCIVVRRESDGVRRYIHFGTGNYNEQTARTYSDISYFTCDDEYGCDASLFFNTITGYSQPMEFRHLSVAPLSIKPKILSLIDGEIQRRKWGQKALIMVKVNALVDPDVIQKLYEASQQGVKIRLNVRGVCCLRPGIPGVSENIRVVSIVDRYLEHARIFYFHNGGNPEIFISSADWMPRNLLRRIELMIPIREENARSRLVSILETVFADNRSARLIRADGGYDPIRPEGRSREVRAQSVFQQKAAAMLDRKKDLRLKHFETHRPNR